MVRQMNISKKQFDILHFLKDHPLSSLDEISDSLLIEHSEILKNIDLLQQHGYLQNYSLTDEANRYFESHRIDNAVILAAGMSTRFVPLNFSTPKGLLKVKGEVLIERQIKQLREKGISEIVVVVGYMKEKFKYLEAKYNVILVDTEDFSVKNNFASVYAARKYLKNSIITSSDLYFSDNIFQTYFYDSYYTSVYMPGKTAERGIVIDSDDKILKTMYGDKCYDIWVTLGYAFFSERFSKKYVEIVNKIKDLPETSNKFWADIQDDNLDDLYMYAKKCKDDCIHEFDSLEELREFDEQYLFNSYSLIMKKICYRLAVKENNIVGIESLKQIRPSMFKFRCRGDIYICDVEPTEDEKVWNQGRIYYQCRDSEKGDIKLYKMDKNVCVGEHRFSDSKANLEKLLNSVRDFDEYHKRALPLCAAENVISEFANLPLGFGFQERYIMNNTYSFNMEDNFIGCEKLFPFYQMLSDACERIFGAKYTDPRPFTGMNCIDMLVKSVCASGDKMLILDKEYGGHASVKPVVERLGIKVYSAPYLIDEMDLDYDKTNQLIEQENIGFILLAPSDLIKPLSVDKINTRNCVLLWDCSQIMGLIAAGLVYNPLKSKDSDNVVMFGGTHKTFPGPASGLIMTNSKRLHELLEKNINPKYLRHSQMHQKISLLFALIEFEKYGVDYMCHVVHCSNYLGERLKDKGFNVANINGQISMTHQIFIRCSKEEMQTIYDNAYKCEVTLNKKKKQLFCGYGIRLGTQEIARYDWNDDALDVIAEIVYQLSLKEVDEKHILLLKNKLPSKTIHFTFDNNEISGFLSLMKS